MKLKLLLILLILAFGVYANLPANLTAKYFRFPRDLSLRMGLDLQGGVHLVYSADTSKLADGDKTSAVESTKANIERRINSLGVSEPLIQIAKSGNESRIIVELAGISDINQAISLIGQTAQLEFRESKIATPSAQTDFTATTLSGSDLERATVQFQNGKSSVGLQFSPEGTKKFAEITKRNIGRPLAIFLDEQMIMRPPLVQNAITDGQAVITGDFTVDEAKRLVINLNAGALPLPIKIIEQRNVGATLGAESIQKSLFAGAVGFGVVCLFMIANYGLKGILADLALGLYVLITLTLVRLIPVTLTLAGIAGVILSIGMAVDANILIFERIKEEMAWGRPKRAAIELGFTRAWNSIKDSNMSSLITAGILFWFGTGSVRGFALTLALGVAVSLFSAITVTKTLLDLVYSRSK